MRVPRWLILAFLVRRRRRRRRSVLARAVARDVTVVSWGRCYGRAQTIALFHPYTDKSGVNVTGEKLRRAA